ncbi:hypothetical protein CGLO_18000 [Colletotrichum gloeosporioides Cg-14]|uniref:Uncharacterized protein n=1 Tax=Colletotrichum gloeosporioides (strain Cg-14) TaxID=1237896 RepID=T0KVJ2_COLGC|nr:hypothetical protein CGLO_18000 [Colletotrichum gloeosporioides Cg-14]
MRQKQFEIIERNTLETYANIFTQGTQRISF